MKPLTQRQKDLIEQYRTAPMALGALLQREVINAGLTFKRFADEVDKANGQPTLAQRRKVRRGN